MRKRALTALLALAATWAFACQFVFTRFLAVPDDGRFDASPSAASRARRLPRHRWPRALGRPRRTRRLPRRAHVHRRPRATRGTRAPVRRRASRSRRVRRGQDARLRRPRGPRRDAPRRAASSRRRRRDRRRPRARSRGAPRASRGRRPRTPSPRVATPTRTRRPRSGWSPRPCSTSARSPPPPPPGATTTPATSSSPPIPCGARSRTSRGGRRSARENEPFETQAQLAARLKVEADGWFQLSGSYLDEIEKVSDKLASAGTESFEEARAKLGIGKDVFGDAIDVGEKEAAEEGRGWRGGESSRVESPRRGRVFRRRRRRGGGPRRPPPPTPTPPTTRGSARRRARWLNPSARRWRATRPGRWSSASPSG